MWNMPVPWLWRISMEMGYQVWRLGNTYCWHCRRRFPFVRADIVNFNGDGQPDLVVADAHWKSISVLTSTTR
jgi:hypothetical protein